ncbi:MAG: hypothetical protein WA140_01810 [Geobacteraceae bacterium]
MSIKNKGKRELPPTHPGLMLREDFMPDYGLTVTTLAEALGVSRQTINELLRERRTQPRHGAKAFPAVWQQSRILAQRPAGCGPVADGESYAKGFEPDSYSQGCVECLLGSRDKVKRLCYGVNRIK